MYQALGFDVGVTFGTLNNLLKQKIWNTAVQTITHIWKMDQYTMYLLFPVRRYQSMMTFIRLSDWWILTFSIEDCTPANAPLLRKMEEISYFCHICKRICLSILWCVLYEMNLNKNLLTFAYMTYSNTVFVTYRNIINKTTF